MRHARPVRVRQQVQFLRRQFAQDNRLPFSEVLTEDLITNTLDALSVVWVDLGNRVHIAAVISSTIP